MGSASEVEVHSAATSASKAQPAWAGTDPYERAEVLLKAARVLEANRDEIAYWIVREGGSIWPKADHEIREAIKELKEAASLAPRLRGEVIPVEARTPLPTRSPL